MEVLSPHTHDNTVFVNERNPFTKVVKNQDGTYSQLLRNGQRYDFDEEGRQVRFTDRYDHAWTYNPNPNPYPTLDFG